jgi:spore germination protein YaaH
VKSPRNIALSAVLVAAGLAGLVLPATSASAVDDGSLRKVLSGWVPYYGIKTSLPSAIANAALLSDVSPFWYSVKDEKTLVDNYSLANPSFPMEDTFTRVTDSRTIVIADPLGQMRRAGLTIIPTINDVSPTGALAAIMANPTKRTSLVKTITNLVLSKRFDGIDLDFEKFAYSDGSASWPTTTVAWIAFIKELSAALHGSGKLLAIDTPLLFNPTSGKKGYWVYAWSDVGPYIDRLRIMGYDYSVDSPGPIGPISWVDNAVSYAVSVMDPAKVFLGFPGYGRDWVTNLVGVCPVDVEAGIYQKLKITGVSVTKTTVTYQATNSLSSGQLLSVTGISNPALNLVDVPIYTRTKDSFTIKIPVNVGSIKSAAGTAYAYLHSVFSTNKATQQYLPYGGTPSYSAAFGETEFTYTRTYNGFTATKIPTACTVTRQGWYQDAQSVAARAALITKYKIGGLAEWVLGQENIDVINSITNVGRTLAVNATITTDTSTIAYGDSFLLGASLKKGDGTQVAGVPVHLTLAHADGAAKTIWSGITDAEGSIAQRIQLGTSGTLALISDSTWSQITGGSSSIAVQVRPIIHWSAPTTMKAGFAYPVVGRILPAAPGVNVHLGAATATTDASGAFSFIISEKVKGFHNYQLTTDGSPQLAAATTDSFQLLVR